MQVFLSPSVGNSSSSRHRAILSEGLSRAHVVANDLLGGHQRGLLVFWAEGAEGAVCTRARRVYHGYEGGAPSCSSVSIHQM